MPLATEDLPESIIPWIDLAEQAGFTRTTVERIASAAYVAGRFDGMLEMAKLERADRSLSHD